MRRRKALSGLRLLLATAALALLGLCAGAAVPGPASADDDDNGDNGDNGGQVCSGSTAGSGTSGGVTTQICTITPADGTDETCIQRSSDPVVVQRCEFTQASATSTLRMTAIQIHNPEGFDGTQDGTQVIKGTQNNTSPSRSNFFFGTQIADYCLGHGDNFEDEDGDWNDEDDDGDRDDDGECEDEEEEDGDDEEESEDDNGPFIDTIAQHQEAHQSIDVTQTVTGTGRNVAAGVGGERSPVLQAQHLFERAANADAITQHQNTVDDTNECRAALLDGFPTNECFTIVQNSNTGANIARLLQVYDLFQSAANNPLGGEQRQGSPNPLNGGGDHGFDQNSTLAPPGFPIQDSDQVERLTQLRTHPMSWWQHGPWRKGVGDQTTGGSNGASANMTQDSVLSSMGPGVGDQTIFLKIQCSSTGTCTGNQHAQTNDDEETNSQSGSVIFMTITCGDVEPDNGDDVDLSGGTIGIQQENGAECTDNEVVPGPT